LWKIVVKAQAKTATSCAVYKIVKDYLFRDGRYFMRRCFLWTRWPSYCNAYLQRRPLFSYLYCVPS